MKGPPGFGSPLKNKEGFKKVMMEPLSDHDWRQIRGMVLAALISAVLSVLLSPITNPQTRQRVANRFRRY